MDKPELLYPDCGGTVTALFPRNFALLRRSIQDRDIDAELQESFAESAGPLSTEGSAGKSGSLFIRSADNRFLLKSIFGSELKTLTRMVPPLTGHVRDSVAATSRRSHVCLLTPFLAAFTLRSKGFGPVLGRATTVVLMPNVFPADRQMSCGPFDLKGSIIGRHSDDLRDGNLKDWDFVQLSDGLPFSPEERRAFWSAAVADAEFLRGQGVTDYSLLAAVSSSSDDSAATGKSKPPSPLSWGARVKVGSRPPRRRRTAGDDGDDRGDKKDKNDSSGGGGGGGGHTGEEVFVGVIDLLQSYSTAKKLEVTSKLVLLGGLGSVLDSDARSHTQKLISASSPEKYADRFAKFCRAVVAPPDSLIRDAQTETSETQTQQQSGDSSRESDGDSDFHEWEKVL
jgi:Phosphatidylinositol-4-phosphate 5-Kinase